MENPFKMDDLGVPLFLDTPTWKTVLMFLTFILVLYIYVNGSLIYSGDEQTLVLERVSEIFEMRSEFKKAYSCREYHQLSQHLSCRQMWDKIPLGCLDVSSFEGNGRRLVLVAGCKMHTTSGPCNLLAG